MTASSEQVPRTPADRRKWLRRLIWVRVIVFSTFFVPLLVGEAALNVRFLLGAVYSFSDLVLLLAAVYALSVCWYALLRLNSDYVVQSYAQIAVDLLLITWTIDISGGIDSYFSPMYFLVIVMAGVLLPSRRAAFVTALVSSVLHGFHLNLAMYGFLPAGGMRFSDQGEALQYVLAMTVFGFCAVGYLTDVLASKWQASNVALKESTGRVAFLQALTSHIIDSLGAGLITTDSNGRIFLFNPAAVRLSGRTAEEAVGSNIRDVFPDLPRDPKVGHCEIVARRPREKSVSLHFSVTELLMNTQTPTGHVWVFDDVTELREMEQELRKQERMAAIGAMSAGIAHEIRNPLASITGSLNLLRGELELGPEQEQLARIITRETERLNQTINDFLAYARPTTPDRKPVYLERLISDTVKLMRNSTTLLHNQVIEADLDPATAEVDENMMRQVFYNLMSNGLKAMPDGGTLRVTLRSTGAKVRIAFADTGIGMTERQIDQLYVPFSSSFKTGTGLGLSIVYQIVSRHDGTIQVESRVGAGTTFTLQLPRSPSGEPVTNDEVSAGKAQLV